MVENKTERTRKKELRSETGVISLEACIVVPMFVFLILFFYGLIIMFTGQQYMCHSLIQCAESLSLDSYANETGMSIENMENGEDLVGALYAGILTMGNKNFSSTSRWYRDSSKLKSTIKDRFIGFLVGKGGDADGTLKTIGVKDGVNGIDFGESKVEDGVLTLVLKYKQEFIFNFGGLASFDRKMSLQVKMWGIEEGE